ncbi:hypothetical protein O181_063191 [Austropuccinia psidii MF-1]|uniref:Uncharacterized protein n=1 Tax=Austropuccinia psidii MF-1 TaxID=1389203 RepID=A0A9Q3ER93_9BASI|nr:hypothetical protein [Austropuccinia psidii MF-1]
MTEMGGRVKPLGPFPSTGIEPVSTAPSEMKGGHTSRYTNSDYGEPAGAPNSSPHTPAPFLSPNGAAVVCGAPPHLQKRRATHNSGAIGGQKGSGGVRRRIRSTRDGFDSRTRNDWCLLPSASPLIVIVGVLDCLLPVSTPACPRPPSLLPLALTQYPKFAMEFTYATCSDFACARIPF